MKKIFSILIAMFIVNIASMAQEQVFSIGTNGDIVTKTKFIEELYSGNYNNVTPYALKFSEKIDAASHIAINNDLTSINNDLTNISKKAANSPNANKTTTAIPLYTVNGLRYKGWDNDPGDFNVIEISYGKDPSSKGIVSTGALLIWACSSGRHNNVHKTKIALIRFILFIFVFLKVACKDIQISIHATILML